VLERPAVADADLAAALDAGYGIAVDEPTFTPLGNDAAAWTYRAASSDGRHWFVKVRRSIRPAGVLVPQFLAAAGRSDVLAPIVTRDARPWVEAGPWSVLVYPFVDAPSGLRAGFDLERWRLLGSFAARLHATTVPAEVARLLPREDFWPKATEMARRVDRHVRRAARARPRDGEPGGDLRDEPASDVMTFWAAHRTTIAHPVRRAEELGAQIRSSAAFDPVSFVPCHADLHIGNVLVVEGGICVVDWDEVMLAPPERDLMFVRGSAVAGLTTDAEARAFEDGYGSAAANPTLIAFYRIDWAVQDLADFARRVLLDRELGEATRSRARDLFVSVFETDGEVDTARAAGDELFPLRATPDPEVGSR
jgi:spectinomycin phosphotransferase